MPDWKISDSLTPDAYFQFATNGYLHPETQLWQLWLSFDGENINWVAAYRSEERITQAREEMQQHIQPGEKWNRQKALMLLDELYAQREFEPKPMPAFIDAMLRLNFTWR